MLICAQQCRTAAREAAIGGGVRGQLGSRSQGREEGKWKRVGKGTCSVGVCSFMPFEFCTICI